MRGRAGSRAVRVSATGTFQAAMRSGNVVGKGVRRLRRSAPAALLLLAALAPASAGAADGRSEYTEYQVKAAFLYNFAKFVKWPDGPGSGGPRPLVITVFGEDPFGDAWNALAGKSV